MASQAGPEAKTAQIAELKQMFAEATKTLDRKTAQYKLLEGRMKQLQNAIKDLEARQKSRDRNVDDVRRDAAQEKARLQEELARLRTVVDDQLKEIVELRGELAAAQEQPGSTSYGAISQASCGQCDGLRVQLTKSKEQLANQTQQLEAVSGEKKKLKERVDYYFTKHTPKLLAVEAYTHVADKNIGRMKKHLADLEKETNALRSEVTALRGRLLSAQEVAGVSGQQQKIIVPPVSTSCAKCADLQAQLDEIREHITERYAQLETVSFERLQLQHQINNLEAARNPTTLSLEVAKLAGEKDTGRLRKLVHQLEKVNEDLQKDVAIVRRQLEMICKRLVACKLTLC